MTNEMLLNTSFYKRISEKTDQMDQLDISLINLLDRYVSAKKEDVIQKHRQRSRLHDRNSANDSQDVSSDTYTTSEEEAYPESFAELHANGQFPEVKKALELVKKEDNLLKIEKRSKR
jgi:hypothetical protein